MAGHEPAPPVKGKVFLVGAGPGDPRLLTLRGKDCLEEADVVIYDYLANPALLVYVPAKAERIYVGRRGRGSYADQHDINRLLIDKAREGKIVVRLKGGDPFVFGRGGEEAEAVAEAGIEFEVVPGVTSAIAVPAYAGIPVTHRTLASAVTLVTGHEDPLKSESTIDWPRLAAGDGTLVFLMGMKNLSSLVAHLRKEGKGEETPVALIRWGTRASQRTIVGTLQTIVGLAAQARLEPPTIIVVGDVVRLRNRLNWFERRPLFGRRILVTRAREQAGELSSRLADYGAEPVEYPVIEVVPPESWNELDRALAELGRYHWLVFTSVNGVRPFMTRLAHHHLDGRALSSLKVCCIGPRTADEVRRHRLTPDLVPAEYQAEGVIDALTKAGVRGRRVLIPRAAVAREILPDQLRAAGAAVDVITVYRTVRPSLAVETLKEQLQAGQIHVMTFASSSTVRNFSAVFESPDEMRKLTAGVPVACIGRITAQTAREEGLSVTILPKESTIPALVEGIVEYVQQQPQ